MCLSSVFSKINDLLVENLWTCCRFHFHPLQSRLKTSSGVFPYDLRYEKLVIKIRVCGLPGFENRVILWAFVCTWYQLVTDGRSDRRTAPAVTKSRSSIAEHVIWLDGFPPPTVTPHFKTIGEPAWSERKPNKEI